MRILLYILFILPFLGYSQFSSEQENKIDSLKQLIKTAKHDTSIIKAWNEWDNIIYKSDPEMDFVLNQKIDSLCDINLEKTLTDNEKRLYLKSKANANNVFGIVYNARGNYDKAIEYHAKSLKIRKELDDKQGIAASLNNLGVIYKKQGDYLKAIDYYTQSLEINKERGDKKGMASSINNIGTIYSNQGDLAKAIDYHTQSLKIREELDDKQGIANCLTSIGIIYFNQKDYNKAIEYYTQSLKKYEEISDKKGISYCLYNIGLVNTNQGNLDKAIDYYSQSLKIREEIGDKQGIAFSLHNIGLVYHDLGNFSKAIDYYSQSLKIQEEINDKVGMANTLNNIGITYYNLGNYTRSYDYSMRSLAIAQETGAINQVKFATKALWKVLKKMGRFKESLAMYELFITTRDSIESEENQKEVIRQEYKYKYEKQAAADSVKNAEAQKVKDAQLAAQKAENEQHRIEAKHQRQRSYFLYGGLAIALLFGGFIFNRYKITNRQKGVISEQKKKVDDAYEELEEKNRDIMDSITYAKRIQSAILPPSKIVKEYLKDSFILYKPKDIVAGDFYWMEHKDGKVLFAAADCTGHGVPGAMVSVVCNNALNRSVREHGLTEPGKILDKTREIVIKEFEKSDEDVQDGMDIALCSLDGNRLEYAGANNPLWIIRKGEIIEIKANKQPIGKYDDPALYTTHTIELQNGDTLYIFSDGYVDQFGGEKGKKFKSKAFKELLLSIQEKRLEEQRLLLDNSFETWRGKLEQIDDVCVIGVRI